MNMPVPNLNQNYKYDTFLYILNCSWMKFINKFLYLSLNFSSIVDKYQDSNYCANENLSNVQRKDNPTVGRNCILVESTHRNVFSKG